MAGHQKILTWILTGAGGNVQTTMLKILDKLGYVEARLMDNTAFIADATRTLWQEIEDGLAELCKNIRQILENSWEKFQQARSKNGYKASQIWTDFEGIAEKIHSWAQKYADDWMTTASYQSPPDTDEILRAEAANKIVKEIRAWIQDKKDELQKI